MTKTKVFLRPGFIQPIRATLQKATFVWACKQVYSSATWSDSSADKIEAYFFWYVCRFGFNTPTLVASFQPWLLPLLGGLNSISAATKHSIGNLLIHWKDSVTIAVIWQEDIRNGTRYVNLILSGLAGGVSARRRSWAQALGAH